MSKIIVVFHSGYGHTLRLAQSIADGAGAELLAIDAEGDLPEGGWEKLNAEYVAQAGPKPEPKKKGKGKKSEE